MRFQTQHEFDYDPTYVVDTQTTDGDGEPQVVTTLEASLPYEVRMQLTKLIAKKLELVKPTLLTPKELHDLEEQR